MGFNLKSNLGTLAYKMANIPIKKLEVKNLPHKEFIKEWKDSIKRKENVQLD